MKLPSESPLSSQALVSISEWLEDPSLSFFRPAIEALVDGEDWQELEDAFYTHVSIGTGGIRGKLGPGPNRINLRTIGEAAQGLSDFIAKYAPEGKGAGVVVGHEARRSSVEFADLCCEIFAANGITARRFDGLRATPEISFAVRHLRAVAGVQITASHNPRTDNGFKFYWSDGGQVVAPLDARFMECVSAVRGIMTRPTSNGAGQGKIVPIHQDVDEAYLGAVRGLSVDPTRSSTIVFSPIHGAGSTNVLPVLTKEGFKVTTVPEQIEPDGSFPTAPGDLINPEYREVMELPIRLAQETSADIAICSDPDADRVGVAAKIRLGRPEVQFLTGNQVGSALTMYLLERRRARGELSPQDVVMTTSVTTGLISDIAEDHGITVKNDLLVGFKFIAQLIAEMEKSIGTQHFVLGTEESLGYLAGNFVRDKDAAIAALLISEMASWLKDQGKTIPDYLDDIYRQYGYYKNVQYLIELPGRSGYNIMLDIMRHLQADPPGRVAEGVSVRKIVDRLGKDRSSAGYRLGNSADMLTLVFSEDARSRMTVRPSGTEPKLKCYVQHYAPVDRDLGDVKQAIDEAANTMAMGVISLCTAGIREELRADWTMAVEQRRVI